MNSPHSNRPFDRLYHLLFLLEHNDISQSDFEELQELLRNDPEAQQAYFRYVDVAIDASAILGTQWQIQLDKSPAPLFAEAKPPEVKGDFLRVIALAALILFCVGLLVYWNRSTLTAKNSDEIDAMVNVDVERIPSHSRREVIVTQSADAVMFRDTVPAIGSPLIYQHEYVLSEGMLELTFPIGAKVVVNSPSVIEVLSEDRMQVIVGSCSVYAPPGAEGFRVDTPGAEVIDLGTRFSVGVSESGETDVHVVEGAAIIRSINDSGETITLHERQSRHFGNPSNAGSSPLKFTSQSYIDQLPDRVVSYEARPSEDGHVSQLNSVTVQRNGSNRTYHIEELIGITSTYFKATVNSSNIIDELGKEVGGPGIEDRVSVIDSDSLLVSGLINFGGSMEPLDRDPGSDPGMAFLFKQPIVNGPGPDVVLFELQSAIDPPEGDSFHVSPLHFTTGLHSHTVQRFDIHMHSAEAKSLATFDQYRFHSEPQSLEELKTAPFKWARPPHRFYALAVGIDLSDLGYKPGALVEGLFLQDDAADSHQIDPVFIAGLPDETAITKDEANKP